MRLRTLRYLLVLVATPLLGGCASEVALGGTYFPAWLVCMSAGLVGAMVLRAVLAKMDLDRHVRPRLIAYPGMMLTLTLTLLTWLIFYSR